MTRPAPKRAKRANPSLVNENRDLEEERELSHIIQDREFEREIARASPDSFVNPGHIGYVGPDE